MCLCPFFGLVYKDRRVRFLSGALLIIIVLVSSEPANSKEPDFSKPNEINHNQARLSAVLAETGVKGLGATSGPAPSRMLVDLMERNNKQRHCSTNTISPARAPASNVHVITGSGI